MQIDFNYANKQFFIKLYISGIVCFDYIPILNPRTL